MLENIWLRKLFVLDKGTWNYDCLYTIIQLGFFTSALTVSLSMKFEWQQVSSSLQDFSQYSVRSQ